MPTSLLDNYVNFIMDSMSQQIKEETLYEYLVNDYKDLSEEEITTEILENYGDEWFEEWNWNETLPIQKGRMPLQSLWDVDALSRTQSNSLFSKSRYSC